ncbi:hypothetical protein F5Y16DRAFT_413488 [Xylariaceae sp. FL0255]|nr:hypothetical protein F5Y16DRAFT_413488 [Xylariaceae sp. FL0255]
MADQSQSKIIQDNPIGSGLDTFLTSFNSICEDKGLSYSPDSLGQLSQEDLRNFALPFLASLQSLPASGLLPSKTRCDTLRSDLRRLIAAVLSDGFDFERIKPLLSTALADNADDTLIWDHVYLAVTESTPPPRTIASSLQQTPWLRNTSSFANSSEHRKYVDAMLKEELGPMYVGLRNFHKTFFGSVAGLETASEAAFKKCMGGSNLLFRVEEGWQGWPEDADQDRVLGWFADLSDKLAALAEDGTSVPSRRRRLLAKPNNYINGFIGKRKMDIGFVNEPKAGKDSRCHWSQILVPGELKSNRSADIASEAWLDLGRYIREVLAAQDTRRFKFDRLGGIAFKQFDINKDGLLFVSTILRFLWMSEEELGFNLTIMTANGQRFMEIERNGSTERLVINKVMRRTRCIAGRATICWKAHRELLREATSRNTINVARYYHHETICIRGNDDIRHGIRKGLDITEARNYRPGLSMLTSNTSVGATRIGRSRSKAGMKRSSNQTDAALPPSKRSCSVSPTKTSGSTQPNQVHRRIILCDYGKPIYEASSRAALLDLAIREQREDTSGAKGKTGTRAFIAIGALLGEQHSFIHDLESFFWVLFWIYIHYNGPNENTEELAKLKKGEVSDEGDFIKTVNRLRKVVFPHGRRWEKDDLVLYFKMKEILREARKDPKVIE